MSGRLVILRHKSWHVWNTDNREKVLKDERLHREEQERLALANRQLVQEQQNELLVRQAAGQDTAEDNGEKPFRLFEDVEKQVLAKKFTGNEDYKREFDAKVLAAQKKEGVAPLALGDGSLEFKQATPWYLKTLKDKEALESTQSSSQINLDNLHRPRWGETSAEQEQRRENERKLRNDPASLFLGANSLAKDVSVSESKEDHDGEVEVVSVKHEKKEKKREHKHHHKKHHKEAKEEKREKTHENDKEKKHKHKRKVGDSDEDRVEDSYDQERRERDEMLQALRMRRLEREKEEAKRTKQLLARVDIYGPSSSSSSSMSGQSYHSQYNPNLSRK